MARRGSRLVRWHQVGQSVRSRKYARRMWSERREPSHGGGGAQVPAAPGRRRAAGAPRRGEYGVGGCRDGDPTTHGIGPSGRGLAVDCARSLARSWPVNRCSKLWVTYARTGRGQWCKVAGCLLGDLVAAPLVEKQRLPATRPRLVCRGRRPSRRRARTRGSARRTPRRWPPETSARSGHRQSRRPRTSGSSVHDNGDPQVPERSASARSSTESMTGPTHRWYRRDMSSTDEQQPVPLAEHFTTPPATSRGPGHRG